MNDYIVDAVDRVLSWDLPDEAIAQAGLLEAGHLAGLDLGALSGDRPRLTGSLTPTSLQPRAAFFSSMRRRST